LAAANLDRRKEGSMPWFSGVVYDAVPEGCTQGVKGGSTMRLKKRQTEYRKTYEWFGNGTLTPVLAVDGEYENREEFLKVLRNAEYEHIVANNYFKQGYNRTDPRKAFGGCSDWVHGGLGRSVVQTPNNPFKFRCGCEYILPANGESSEFVVWQTNKIVKRGGSFACRVCAYASGKRSRENTITLTKQWGRKYLESLAAIRVMELESTLEALYGLCAWQQSRGDTGMKEFEVGDVLKWIEIRNYEPPEYTRRKDQIERVREELFTAADGAGIGKKIRKRYRTLEEIRNDRNARFDQQDT
jgi:hypothetical protein